MHPSVKSGWVSLVETMVASPCTSIGQNVVAWKDRADDELLADFNRAQPRSAARQTCRILLGARGIEVVYP